MGKDKCEGWGLDQTDCCDLGCHWNGLPTTLCATNSNCGGNGAVCMAQSGPSYTLKAWTSNQYWGATGNTVRVEFKVCDQWTIPQDFFTGASKKSIKQKKFNFPSLPTYIRLSIDGDDGWSFYKIQLINPN